MMHSYVDIHSDDEFRMSVKQMNAHIVCLCFVSIRVSLDMLHHMMVMW